MELLVRIRRLWRLLATHERHERPNDSKNSLLAEARRGARMEAYTRLMEIEIDRTN